MGRELDNSLVISFLDLRKTIGFLGLSLPFLVSVGARLFFDTGLQYSLSAYYYTGTRDVFVGALWAIGFVLFAYKGYNGLESWLSTFAGAFAVGVSLFPTAPNCASCSYNHVASVLHYLFAGALFILLSIFSLAFFPKTDSPTPTPRKLKRNVVYKIAGITMLVSIALIPATKLIPGISEALQTYDPEFWLETILIVAFGISWLTKGEAILADL